MAAKGQVAPGMVPARVERLRGTCAQQPAILVFNLKLITENLGTKDAFRVYINHNRFVEFYPGTNEGVRL
jgi:hypothetical protein